MEQIKAEDTRLHAVKAQSKAGSEEARQCDIGFDTLGIQRDVLWTRLYEQAAEQEKQLQGNRGEEPSAVEITMEMDEIDTKMDTTIVEQGKLPKADQTIEEQVYERLVKFEMNNIQWRYEALSYLVSILEVNQQARTTADETRTTGQAYPKIWAYLGYKNLLTRYEMEMGMEDPHTSAEARFKAAQKAYKTWHSQQTRTRKPSQSPGSSRSRVDQSRPPTACIRYDNTLAEVLFGTDYDEDDFLVRGINLFNPFDSDNDVTQKLLQLQELCATCGQTPADELDQQTLLLLRTFGFGDDQPKKKLMVFLGMQRNKNTKALQVMSNEATARFGLNELADEGIYEVNINRSLDSAVLELQQVHTMNILSLTTKQESIWEQICVRLWQTCEDALLDFSIDE